MDQPKAIVLTGFGVNCDNEMAKAFELAGASATRAHINDVIAGRLKLDDFHALALPGGFSFGDDIASGKVFANKLKFGLGDEIARFIGEKKLVIGICNGFQMLVKMGLLPALDGNYREQLTTLTFNDSGRFESRWIRVAANPRCNCVFTQGIGAMDVPVRHGEGKFIPLNDGVMRRLDNEGLVAFRYCDEQGAPTQEYPLNPNGSLEAVAGICDPTGRVFGMMPHPEAHLFRHNHPHWAREKTGKKEGDGLKIFRNAVAYLKNEF